MTLPDAPRSSLSLSTRLRGLRVLHPLPSVINALLVGSLASIAGAEPLAALVLALGMLGFQVSIGALNDLVDAEADRLVKPDKPLPAGLVSRHVAMAIVVAGGLSGLAVSAGHGLVVLVLGAAGYACGVAYDLVMRRRGLGWLCFSAAFPLLLVWTWIAASGEPPPGWLFLLPMAAIAGPTIHLSNSLVDMESDVRVGRTSLATQLGLRPARAALASLVAVVCLLAWASLLMLGALPALAVGAALLATIAAAVGVALSWQPARNSREAGWLLQAGGLALLAGVWVAAVATV